MPKTLTGFTVLLGIAQLIALIWVLNPIGAMTGSVTRFEVADRCDEPPNFLQLNSDSIGQIIDKTPSTRQDCWHQVILPENNPVQNVKLDNHNPQLRRTWYRVSYPVPKNWPESKPLMIYVPRIMAHAWQIRINGRPVADNRFEWRMTWNRPVGMTFFLESPLSNSTNSTLSIEVGVISNNADGFSMSRITVGDDVALRNQKAFRDYLQVTIPQSVSTVIFLMGLFFLSFWLVRRSEKEYLMLVFTSLAMGIGYFKYSIAQSGDPIRDAWYNAFVLEAPTPWLIWFIYLFNARYAGFSIRWLEWLLWLYVIVIGCITLSPISLQQDYGVLKGLVSLTIGLVVLAALIWQAIVTRNTGLRFITVGAFFAQCAGFESAALGMNVVNPEWLFLSPYAEILVFSTYLYAIQRRYVAAIVGQERLNNVLEIRLAEREALTEQLTKSEAELRAKQSRLLELERIQTLAQERQRLMHDMHDGLGSSLLTTLAAIEKNTMPQQAVAEALRACIDDLRLVIDSLEPTANDLVTLLGTIRYRLGQRLTKAGLELKWEINDLPPLPWLEPPDALNVLRLVQEALVNILKHANVSAIEVKTSDLGDNVEIQINDNGCGYDPGTIVFGRGMPSQAKRAERLGGELQIISTKGQGTSLRLRLPINKNRQAQSH